MTQIARKAGQLDKKSTRLKIGRTAMYFEGGYTYSNFLMNMLGIFAFVVWFWLLIVIYGDLFRRHDISGWGNALLSVDSVWYFSNFRRWDLVRLVSSGGCIPTFDGWGRRGQSSSVERTDANLQDCSRFSKELWIIGLARLVLAESDS